MMARFSIWAKDLVGDLLPSYGPGLTPGPATFRPCPRSGPQRLHVDSFFLFPTEGRRVLREFLAHLDDVALLIDGFHTLIVETDLAGNELSPPERSSSRLFRNSPDLRYMGRVHEEIRYLPDPPRTVCAMLEGGPHIQHLGMDTTVRARRGKRERDLHLLHLRLADNPHDAVAMCYLALYARAAGNMDEAADWALRALECGPRTLHEDRRVELETLAVLTGRS